jgi:hypothetical protein
VTVLERIIGNARVEAEDQLFRDLSQRVDEQTRSKILALLKVRPGEKTTPFQQLQRAAGRPSPDTFNREVDALVEVRALLPDDLDLGDLDGQLVERLALMVSGLPTKALAQHQEAKRVGLLLLWLWRLRTQLIDTALTVSHELIAGALRHARNAAVKEQQKQNKRVAPLLTICGDVVLRQNSDLQQTLDFPLHPRYSRLDDPRLTCLRFYTCLRIQTPSGAGAGESRPPTTTGRLSSPPSATATAPTRSPLLGLALQSLESMALGPLDRQAGDRSPLASRRI